MIRRWWVVFGLMLSTVVAREAHADDTHYRGVPIGAHAIGLGGAFAGVADDASAAFFNPAGLALRGNIGIAGGFSVNAWDRLDLDRAYAQPDGAADSTTKRARTVPIFIGAGIKFGPKDAYDRKRFAIGISVLEPLFSGFGAFVTIESDPLALSDSYKVEEGDRATWYGVSFASRLNLKQSIGASLYLSVRRLNHSEVGLTLDGGTLADDSDPLFTFVGTNTVANNQNLGFKAFHFVLRFGWLYRIKPQLQFGLMVQPPGIPLKQTVQTFSQGFFNDNSSTPPTTEAYFFDERLDANLPIPAEIEAGLEYWPAEQVMLAFDASFHAPAPGGQRVKTAVPVPIGGVFWDNDTGRRAIGNVAIAGDFFITRKVMLEAGFFTDLSSALKIPENPDRFHNARIHRLGGTLSVGLNVVGISLAIGSTFIYGKGDATGVVVDLSANRVVDYIRTDARSRLIYLHITGATQAASDVSRKAAEGIRERRRRKKREAEEAKQRQQEVEEAEQEQRDAGEAEQREQESEESEQEGEQGDAPAPQQKEAQGQGPAESGPE